MKDHPLLPRREFLHRSSAMSLFALTSPFDEPTKDIGRPAEGLRVSVFSKHLQWLNWQGLAEVAKEIGFDGIDLTVRQGGHIAPERAEKDLPQAAEIIRKAGLSLPMITSGIVDTKSPHAESILRAMKASGIPLYRWGGFRYLADQPIPQRLDELRVEAAKLADLNNRYSVGAMYHTHSGSEVGASIWDLWLILKDLNHERVGVNLDIAHATIEGGLGAWITNTRLIASMIRGVAIKDYRWAKNSRGESRPQWCPLGEGMVDFKRFFAMLKTTGFSGPLQLHFEYPLGGAEGGSTKLNVDRAAVINAMRRDLSLLRQWLRDAQLA